MAKKNRDEFSPKTVLQIAKRAGWLCSYPACRTPTVGATSDGDGEINIGTAAHICAAAPGGPRYDEKTTSQERSSAKNGIWMCRDHGKAIDSTDPEFTVERLREWKQQAEKESWQRVLRNERAQAPAVPTGDAQLAGRLRAAAEADLKVFRRTAKWPATSVALTLEVDGFDAPITTRALAEAVASLDDLILVASPGMGKTTTLFQIAEGVLTKGIGTPLVVPLGDWATEGATILASILARPAFRGISEDDFHKAAAQPGLVLLLDGWNELDMDARKRARVQVDTLKAQWPELGLVVSTRRQALDVPFGGTRVDILPLNEDQQMQIAVALRGDSGAKMLDQAWRTDGVRELVTIPLYLTALLSLSGGAPFPSTKEEVLRHFVAAHEKEARRAEALRVIAEGFQQDYLGRLAVFATRTGNTAIADNDARRSVSETAALLVENGQITIKPRPEAILDVLVSNHVLMRAGDMPGVSFQHQQFQEWYASHSVERRIVAGVDIPDAREALQAEVFDLPAWEEAILFAVERLARGDEQHRAACGKAIVAAFEVDPVLAAEMIFRSTEDVWTSIAPTIQSLVARWHAPGKVDRALRFMLTSGRAEFLDAVWPLITNENSQVSLRALRNCGRFRPSILGKDAEKKIKSLSSDARMVLLHEMAARSGMDGLDLAATIAKSDPDPEVQASVVDALAFRRADRHVAMVLHKASDATFDLVARKGLIDKVDDVEVQKGLVAAHKRQAAEVSSAYDRLRRIVDAQGAEDHSAEVTDVITKMEIDGRQDAGVQYIYMARKRYGRAVADGLLARVRVGHPLFYGADDVLASAGFALEDDDMFQIAMSEGSRHDDRAEAAASVLGPKAVGRMIDALLDMRTKLRVEGKNDSVAVDRYHNIEARLAHTPGASLIQAVRERSAQADNETMARLAGLLSRRPEEDGSDRGRPFNADGLAAIRALVEDWGNRMLTAGDAQRWHVAQIATLASHAPSIRLLPLLKRMLDDNLRRYRNFREQAQKAGWRHGDAVDEARQPMTFEYQRAFLAINAPETAALMREYLTDEHFGELAAQVLASQWRTANEPPSDRYFLGSVDFRRVEEKRAARAAELDATSDEADAIFAVIEELITEGATDAEKKLAASLGVVAARLPHGRRDATVQKLVALAPRRARAALLLGLVLSGHVIDISTVKAGLAEVMEAGAKQSWILSEGHEPREWLRLLPFTDRPAETLSVVQSLPAEQIRTDQIEELIRAFGYAPGDDAENVLQAFAEAYPMLYANRTWRDAVSRRDTESAARQFVDLAASGKLEGRNGDRWHTARQIGALLDKYPTLRQHVYGMLKDGAKTPGLALLAEAVAENPDADGLLLLLSLEAGQKRTRISWRTVEGAVTKHVPVENWKGAYSLVPVPAAELRQKLLAMTKDGGPGDAAARCLNAIERVRDEYGRPETEPRHPDIASGKAWPIMRPDPDDNTD